MSSDMTFLGFDPGGQIGAAVVRFVDFDRTEVEVCTVSSVDDAVEWAIRVSPENGPIGAGIDAPLSWSTTRSGWRPMDRFLRERYPTMQKSVLSSNSAFGAMAVQGMALAIRLRERWPSVALNETHPKVLYHALTGGAYARDDMTEMIGWLQNCFDPPLTCRTTDEHQWDALISAWGTWQGITDSWQNDLCAGHDDLLFPAGKVRYYWPAPIDVLASVGDIDEWRRRLRELDDGTVEGIPAEEVMAEMETMLQEMEAAKKEQKGIDESWSRELARRIRDMESGAVQGIPGDEVIRRLEARLGVKFDVENEAKHE